MPILLHSQNIKKVLIIGIDGCRPDALQAAYTPNIDSLIANGIFSPDAQNDDITISGPGWSAILCGVWSDKHLVTDNSFNVDNYENYPSIFKHLKDTQSTFHTVSICHWSPINEYIVQEQADFKLNVSSDLEVANQASSYLNVNDPDLVFLHFDEADVAGHSYGFAPNIPEYINTIESIDVHIGTVIETIEQRPNYSNEDWLVLVTTDHGGIGTNHGGNSPEEKNVFVIASGKNITPKVVLKDSTVIINEIENCLGDSIELKFDGADDFVQVLPNMIYDFGENQDFTIECRIRSTQGGDVAIVGNKDWGSGYYKGFVFSFSLSNGDKWKVNIGDDDNRADIDTGGEITDNEWHTLSVAFDRDGFMKMYEDGLLVDSTDISFIEDINTNEGLFFGADINGNYDYTGSIAEVRIWNSLINEQVIEEWYCSPLENTHPDYNDLIGYWKLNDGIGINEVVDHSTYGNNGAINGTEWISTSDSIVLYNYDLTPRLIDIVPTALTHFCIPIEEDWDLDGTSLIPDCTTTNVEGFNKTSKEEILIYPNPSTGKVNIDLKNVNFTQQGHLSIFDISGKKIYEHATSSQNLLIDVSNFQKGIYILKLFRENKEILSKKLIISSN